MAKLIKGKEIAAKIEARLIKRVKKIKARGLQPKLAVIFVGDHKPSETYIRKKQEAAERVGLGFSLHTFRSSIEKNKLIGEIKKIQTDPNLAGLIVQLPLPERLYTSDVLNAISPNVDVDCLTDTNVGKLVMGTNFLYPPTPEAVLVALNDTGTTIQGKNITILGTGPLVGRPLSIMLMNEGASVTTCNKRTKNVREKTLTADIVVSAVGKKNLIRGNMIKKGTIVIDTGISYIGEKMYGDANAKEVRKKASYFTPTPGGIGPITVALLLQNTVICAEKKIHKK
ncbi:MAG TPA: bifunctional 5,10-methylenetetrahydrofolate dehydrogenase/5,10-methenyltetrahydrofolate cyclohydrolase [Patescibacteria group bacterium]|nr:bifunctional 5,10-methylenetetrahydrofolate dehydrogenase/5,10-methenyltetrahydrofolate cyclohydrolase [Patescibacteria group bacterium]